MRCFAGPNVELVPMCKNGLGPELVAVQVRTRNKTGVAARSLLCCNYGTDFDFSLVEQKQDDTPEAKRFKGKLDKMFQNQLEGQLREARSSDAKDLKEETMGKEEKAKEKDELKDKEKDKEKDKGPEKAKETDQEKGKEKKDDQTGARGVTALSQLDVGSFGMKGDSKENVQLFLLPADDAKGNKRVSPGTVLYVIANGKVIKGQGGLQYSFDKPDKILVHLKEGHGKELEKQETLAALVQRKKIKQLCNAPPFPAGTIPKNAGKSGMQFRPTDDNMLLLLLLASTLQR